MTCVDIVERDCITWLSSQPEAPRFSMVYLDPPFCTGKTQKGRSGTYDDGLDRDGLIRQIEVLVTVLPRVCTPNASLFLHLDWRTVHYAKVLLDETLGEDSFRNEIIWAYDYGGRPKDCWARKHDTILWYSFGQEWIFNLEASDRIPYMAPSLVGGEKAARGKHVTDVMWHTVAPTQGPERTGYPTQKPLGLLTRLVAVHSNPGDTVLDLFAGSGTTGQAAKNLGRHAVLVDRNPEAIAVMQKRLG